MGEPDFSGTENGAGAFRLDDHGAGVSPGCGHLMN